MSANLGKLSLSVLHTKRLPRPSQTHNENCPDRGAARFTIHVSRAREPLNDEDDPDITDVVIRFHAPQHPEHTWSEYVHTFQPIIQAGMQALFEYAYEYGMRRSGRALRFQEGNIDDWITEDIVEGVAATARPRNHYMFGKEWEAINFDDGLFLPERLPGGLEEEVPTEFIKMCEVVIDRMCTGTCSVLRPPVFRRDEEDEFGEPDRLTCCVLLCAANGLGYEAWRAPMQCDRGQGLYDPQWASLA